MPVISLSQRQWISGCVYTCLLFTLFIVTPIILLICDIKFGCTYNWCFIVAGVLFAVPVIAGLYLLQQWFNCWVKGEDVCCCCTCETIDSPKVTPGQTSQPKSEPTTSNDNVEMQIAIQIAQEAL